MPCCKTSSPLQPSRAIKLNVGSVRSLLAWRLELNDEGRFTRTITDLALAQAEQQTIRFYAMTGEHPR